MTYRTSAAAIVTALALLGLGCSSSNGGGGTGGSGTGGATSSGGVTSSGGSSASGGVTSSGGSSASGGVTSSGGSSASGGVTSSGGSSASGGVTGSGGSTGSGGASGGATGTQVTTLSSGKELNSLSTDEGEKLCGDTYAYFGRAIPQATSCKWKGLSYATSSSAPTQDKLRQNCTSKETGCQALAADAVWPNPGCEFPATCAATVAQWSACISEQAADFTKTVDGLPACSEFTSSGTSAIWDVMGSDPTASCMTLSNKCPDLSIPYLVTF